MQRGPLIPTVALALGIAVSSVAGLAWWIGLILIVAAGALYVAILRFSADPVVAFRIGKWHWAWVILLFLGIGMTDESFSRPMTIEESNSGKIPTHVTCEVKQMEAKTYGDRLDLLILGTNGTMARIRSGVTEVARGDLVSVPSKYLKEIDKDTSAYVRANASKLKASGLMYTGWIPQKSIDIVGRTGGVLNWAYDMRESIEIKIERSHLCRPTSEFIKAILMGDKSGLDASTRLTFANGGTAHMLALSGLHIAILSGFILFLFWPFNLMGKYKLRYVMAIILLWVYVVLTGLSFSSVRACVMTTLAFIAIIAERKNNVFNALCSACMLILIADPSALFNAGFQLSAVCVWSLVVFATPLNPIGRRHHPRLYYICGVLITAMTATAASWALTSYYFSQVPLMFLPANALLLPLLPFYMALAVIFVVMLCLGIDIVWMARILDYGYDFLLWGMRQLSGGTEFVVDYQLPGWGCALWFVALSACAYMINKRKATIR